jgi:predicted transcriptional regulator
MPLTKYQLTETYKEIRGRERAGERISAARALYDLVCLSLSDVQMRVYVLICQDDLTAEQVSTLTKLDVAFVRNTLLCLRDYGLIERNSHTWRAVEP